MVSLLISLLLILVPLLVLVARRPSGSSHENSLSPFPRIGFSDLWRWDGTIDRGPYTLVGIVGFAVKHNLDRLVATVIFHRPWGLFNYVIPLDEALRITGLPQKDIAFLATMVALALPFIWVGVALTLRRLRATGLPLWLVVVFFLPVINLAFFILLAILPSRSGQPYQIPGLRSWWNRLLDRVIPEHRIGNAAMALLVTSLFGIAATALGVSLFSTYGWGLFVGLPFCVGLLSVLLYGYHQPRSYRSCLSVSISSAILLAAALLAVAIEGLVCLIMAAPLGIAVAILGGSIGYVIQRRSLRGDEAPAMLLALFLFAPTLMGAESAAGPQAPLFTVRTAIDIDASPRHVWRHVVSFAKLPEPEEWLFRIGIAYPIQAKILGEGVGAERVCEFSTGSFVEPIEVWDEPRLLKFSVIQNPPPMQEWTPYSAIHPPHLNGFLVSEGGQFLLTQLSGGGTRLEGTTWYRHHMWPASYWHMWSDLIIHRIHLRVLKHIKRLAEHPGLEDAAEPPRI